MKTLVEIMQKESLLVIGLMSGTSLDGMDAALVRLDGHGTATKAECLAFASVPYTSEERSEILELALGAAGGSKRLALMNFWMGEKALEACRAVCSSAGISADEIDLVGSHGQTLYHIPVPEEYLGRSLMATYQTGEASVISEGIGCPVVSDFRVRDMAAGGQAAPLVPYSEFLLYRREDKNVGLQNIGGIGNLTVLPKACTIDQVYAFDTGPGNMVIDRLVVKLTEGRMRWDENGAIAAKGSIDTSLLRWMLDDPYLEKRPPKTTGREMYGDEYIDRLLEKADSCSVTMENIIATATRFTVECIATAWERFCPEKPKLLIVGGGGAHNLCMMNMLRERLPIPVMTNEDLGLNGDAKEAVAFAVLANECVHGGCNNVISVTGAKHPVVMGKITQ